MRQSGIQTSNGISMSSGLTDPLISNPEIGKVGRARGRRDLGEAQEKGIEEKSAEAVGCLDVVAQIMKQQEKTRKYLVKAEHCQ